MRTLEVVVRRLLSPSQRLERDLQAWLSYLVLPLFALANADIPLSAGALGLLHSISLAVFLGLVIAKPLDITLGARVTVRISLASKPEDIAWRQLAGAGVLYGISFTMFFYHHRRLHQSRNNLVPAKLGVMLTSMLAGTAGWIVLRGALSKHSYNRAASEPAMGKG